MSLRTVRFFLIAAGCVFVAAAQNQPQAYVVDTCVKAAPGKQERLRGIPVQAGTDSVN